jgi:gamma-glutamylputrescine oxidase
MKLSFWELDSYFNSIDVAIIGSGIVGLTTALYLKEKKPKLKIIVFERGALPSGASTKNAGFACFGSPSEILADIHKTNEIEVLNLLKKRYFGLAKLRKLLGDKSIDYKAWGGYELFDTEEQFDLCASQLGYINELAASFTLKKNTYSLAQAKIENFGFKQIKHLIFNSEEGQIDPGKMMKALILKAQKAGVLILNGISCQQISSADARFIIGDAHEVQAKKLVITTNGFARELLPELDVKPARAQVLITKPIADLKIKGTFHYDEGYYYFRNIGQRLLFGGGRNLDFKGEETSSLGLTRQIQNQLERMLRDKIIPNQKFEVEHRWSGIMGVGEVKSPIVKALNSNLFCAVRMGGMGIALGSSVGEVVGNLVIESL